MDAHMHPYTCKICHHAFKNYATFESHLCVVALGDERFIQVSAAVAREEDFRTRFYARIQEWCGTLS